jgi:hypothetical protein
LDQVDQVSGDGQALKRKNTLHNKALDQVLADLGQECRSDQNGFLEKLKAEEKIVYPVMPVQRKKTLQPLVDKIDNQIH